MTGHRAAAERLVLLRLILICVNLCFSSWANSTEDSDLSIHGFEKLVLFE